jgi:hypothetical protein
MPAMTQTGGLAMSQTKEDLLRRLRLSNEIYSKMAVSGCLPPVESLLLLV